MLVCIFANGQEEDSILHFGNKPSLGFFAEGFEMFNIDDYEVSDFTFGISFGAKFITRRNITFQFYGDVGRNLFNDEVMGEVARIGNSVGKRFLKKYQLNN